jgi:hypothetical protein
MLGFASFIPTYGLNVFVAAWMLGFASFIPTYGLLKNSPLPQAGEGLGKRER